MTETAMCGHSACVQSFIDTGELKCLKTGAHGADVANRIDFKRLDDIDDVVNDIKKGMRKFEVLLSQPGEVQAAFARAMDALRWTKMEEKILRMRVAKVQEVLDALHNVKTLSIDRERLIDDLEEALSANLVDPSYSLSEIWGDPGGGAESGAEIE